MAKFTVTIETEQEYVPANRLEQTREQYKLRDVLVLVTSAVVGRGLNDGTVIAIEGARASFSYSAKPPRKTAARDLPPAA